MVRSEEEVSVGTRQRVTGRARLRKHVVTEHVQKTVPVQRERVSVELEPADDETDAPAGDRHADADPRPDRDQR
jgi:stress response protein YsnF